MSIMIVDGTHMPLIDISYVSTTNMLFLWYLLYS